MSLPAQRNRLAELSAYLHTHFHALGISRENFETFISDATTQKGSLAEKVVHDENDLPVAVWHLFDFSYDAHLFFERLPLNSIPLLMGLVETWLASHDDLRDTKKLARPNYEFIDTEKRFTDIDLSLSFVDEFYVAPAEDGVLEWNGKQYNFGTYDLDIAEDGEVGHERT